MTVAEVTEAFESYIDQYSTARPTSVDFWINEAIEGFVKLKLSPYLKGPNLGFQINQRVRDELSNVIKTGVSMAYANGVADYPSDCFEILPNSIGCSTAEQSTKENTHIYARPRTWDWYYANQLNPFTKPKFKQERLTYIEDADGINILPGLAYTDVIVSYIATWTPFSTAGDDTIPLRDKTHRTVTKLAAAKYLNSIRNYDGAKVLMSEVVAE